MMGRILATMVGAACLFAAADVGAQTPNLYDRCRDEAIRQNKSGAGLSDFMNQCIQQNAASGSMERRASFDRCRADGVARGISGEALYDHVNTCLQGSGSAEATAMTGTYQQCRAQARARQLGGDDLNQFLNACVAQ